MKEKIIIVILTIIIQTNLSYAYSNLFDQLLQFPTESFPEAVAIGDINGDGRADAVLVTSFYLNDNDSSIMVFLQNTLGDSTPRLGIEPVEHKNTRPLQLQLVTLIMMGVTI